MSTETAVSLTSTSTAGIAPFQDDSAFSVAYERRLPEILAVPQDKLAPLNVDVHAAVTTVLGTLPELRALRDQMTQLPHGPADFFDALEDYAHAAGEANSRYVTATAPAEDIAALNDEALAVRETLRSDATALANRHLIDPARLTPFKGLVGYKNVAFELIDYANLLRDCWPTIQGKTALQAAEVQHAKNVGERLVRAAGLREQGPAVVADAARIRQQAYTLLVNAYDQARRAVIYLRWNEGDADTIAPSLYAGRGGRPRKDQAAQGTEVGAPAGAVNAAPTAAAPSAAAPVNGGAAPGFPGARPFADA